MGRGRGKGKRGGRGGGGRQHFISSLEELEARNERDEAWAARRKAEREAQEDSGSGDEEGGKNDDDDSESGDEGRDGSHVDASVFAPRGEVSVEVMEPKKSKPKGVQGLIEVDNPNAKPKSGKMMKAKVGTLNSLRMNREGRRWKCTNLFGGSCLRMSLV